ncbi:MAG: phage integrase N-terminal SAM-like domain-containing protein [Burkholderiales bacterium]
MSQASDFPKVSANSLDKPRLLDQVRHVLRLKHYSRRTEKSYIYWIKYFIFHHGRRHPTHVGGAEITQLLSFLASDRDVVAATQNQALSAPL